MSVFAVTADMLAYDFYDPVDAETALNIGHRFEFPVAPGVLLAHDPRHDSR
jgi:hypothetical protein